MMMGSMLSRALIMVFGYVYPAYQCFKTVENHKTEMKQFIFWCQYWILVAMLTVCERVGDNLISWFPMYNEAKLAMFVYLWYPKTRGCSYVYDCFFRPLVAKHEKEIDEKLLELKVKAQVYWDNAATYGQHKFFEILQYVSSQSSSFAHPNQVQDSRTDEVRQADQQKEKEGSRKSDQLHEKASELEKLSIQLESSLKHENSHLPEQDTLTHDSVRLSHNHHHRWRLFHRTGSL